MKTIYKIIFTTVILVLTSVSMNSQTDCEKVVHRLGVYLCQDAVKNGDLDTDKKMAIKEGVSSYKDDISESSITELTTLLSTQGVSVSSNLIKNKFEGCSSDTGINDLINGITIKLEEKDSRTTGDDLYDEFKGDLKKIAEDSNANNELNEEPNANEENSSDENEGDSNDNDIDAGDNVEDEGDSNSKANGGKLEGAGGSNGNLIIYIALGLILVGIVFLYLQNRNLKKSLYRLENKRENDKQRIVSLEFEQRSIVNNTKADLDTIENRFIEQTNVLSKQIEQLKTAQVSKTQTSVNTNTPKPIVFEPKTFFAQYPDSSEPLGFRTMHTETNSKLVYVINTVDKTKAKFSIQPSENTQQYAIGNHAKILKPICDYYNQPSSVNKSIKVIDEGALEFRNGIWIVVKNLNIKFE